MKKIYYLSTCDTCRRLMKQLPIAHDVVLQDVKKQPITELELEELRFYADSYEQLFNKRAQLYKERKLKDQSLSETDYKNFILEHYTFLKRPIVVTEKRLYIADEVKELIG
ncbi:MAG: ArsC/Spx/MgsR family protein [Capnocytophaga sp.]|nr:ArsC/Spx/MgsR family protein [Capnocytophaga sp.]